MSSKQVRAYKQGQLILERRALRYVPLDIPNNTTELVNNATQNLPPPVSEVVARTVLNLTRNDVCIQNQVNERICYLFGKYPTSLAVTRTVVV